LRSDSHADTFLEDVYAKRFTSTGAATTVEQLANEYRADAQMQPAIAMDASGDAVVAWQSLGQDAPASWGVFARRFEETTELSAPIVTGVTAAGNEVRPAGERMSHPVTSVALQFSENLWGFPNTGADSAINTANYRLTRDGVDESSRIASASFGLNIISRKYEARLTLTGVLPDGLYVLSAHPSLRDLEGNTLDGNLDGVSGGGDGVAPAFRAERSFPVDARG
jgi:hypothetical protein